MSVHVVIQPTAGYGAEVIEPLPGVRQGFAGNDDVGMTIQVPARIGGLSDTARSLADLVDPTRSSPRHSPQVDGRGPAHA